MVVLLKISNVVFVFVIEETRRGLLFEKFLLVVRFSLMVKSQDK